MTFIFFVLSLGYLVSQMDSIKENTGISSVILLSALFVYSIFAYENLIVIFAVPAIIEVAKGFRGYGKFHH